MSRIIRGLVILSSIFSGHCFAEIARIRNSRKTKTLFAETNADPKQAGSSPENDSEKIALIVLLSELPSKKNKVLQEPTKASAQVELEGSLEISTSSVKTEQESTSSNCDLKGTRDTQTFHWFHEPQNWDNLCPPQEVANKKDMAVRHTKLYSSFVRLEELKKLGAKKGEKRSKTTRRNILEEASRVERLVNEYDSCWTEPGWPSAQSLFESSKNLNEKKEPKTMSSLTSSTLEVTMKTGSTQEKSRRTQAEVRRTDEFPSPPYQPLCHLRTKFT